jgi:hypothetical protein
VVPFDRPTHVLLLYDVDNQIWPSLEKLDYLVCYSRTSDFDNFRAKLRKKLNLKIQCVLKKEKGLKYIKRPR